MPPPVYSVSSFKKILLREINKGRDISYLHQPTKDFNEKIKSVHQEGLKTIKSIKADSSLCPEERTARIREEKIRIAEAKRELRKSRDERLKEDLQAIKEKLNNNFDNCQLEVIDAGRINTRKIFRIRESFESFVITKQVEAVLRDLHSTQGMSRHDIAKCIKVALNQPYDVKLLKIDIEKYFDNIDPQICINKLKENSENRRPIDPITLQLIENILKQYQLLCPDSNTGIPQGIGISNQLAQIYLSEFDESWRRDTDVAFYARYVDDIIIIFNSKHVELGNKIETAKELLKGINLTINEEKTQQKKIVSCIRKNNQELSEEWFNYLGYRFGYECYNNAKGKQKIVIGLPRKRIEKIKRKIDKSFESCQRTIEKATSTSNNQIRKEQLISSALGLLYWRLYYLSSNTILRNSKSRSVVGVYFSNLSITTDTDFLDLDKYCDQKLQELSSRIPEQKDKIKRIKSETKFVDGFKYKRFKRFSPHLHKKITIIWKDID